MIMHAAVPTAITYGIRFRVRATRASFRPHRGLAHVFTCRQQVGLHSMHCPEIGRSDTQVGRPRQRMIFVQMAGLLAMPTLLPEGVLSAEGEDAQAVNSS